MAIEAGQDVALVSKEVDSVVGPELARRAAARGKLVTPVDGDQPSLLIALVSWAEVLGFDIVCAGKSSEYDFVYDRGTGELTSNGRTQHRPGLAALWDLGAGDAAETCAARVAAAEGFALRAVPDLCELQVVANATGLMPDRSDFHAPIARIAEVPTILATTADGGLLSGERRLDVFHCLREPHEPSFAGGVFVVVRARDRASWEMLAAKGHAVSRSGETAMVYVPRHLLGLEAATSILDWPCIGCPAMETTTGPGSTSSPSRRGTCRRGSTWRWAAITTRSRGCRRSFVRRAPSLPMRPRPSISPRARRWCVRSARDPWSRSPTSGWTRRRHCSPCARRRIPPGKR